MVPTTRASKGPNFVHIALHNTHGKKIDKVRSKLLQYLPHTKKKYVQKLVHGLQIAAAAGETREDLEASLNVMNSLMSEIKRVKQQKALLDGYAEIGDLVYDYLTPYKNWIAADWGGRKLGEFWARWARHGGPTNEQAAESIYLLRKTRDKNPHLDPAQNRTADINDLQNEYTKIAKLIETWSQGCNKFHRDIRGMSPQGLWNHLRTVENRIRNGGVGFTDENTKTLIIEFLDDYRDRHYSIDTAGNLAYTITGNRINP